MRHTISSALLLVSFTPFFLNNYIGVYEGQMTVSTLPTMVVYGIGESFVPTGMVAKVSWNATPDIADVTATWPDSVDAAFSVGTLDSGLVTITYTDPDTGDLITKQTAAGELGVYKAVENAGDPAAEGILAEDFVETVAGYSSTKTVTLYGDIDLTTCTSGPDLIINASGDDVTLVGASAVGITGGKIIVPNGATLTVGANVTIEKVEMPYSGGAGILNLAGSGTITTLQLEATSNASSFSKITIPAAGWTGAITHLDLYGNVAMATAKAYWVDNMAIVTGIGATNANTNINLRNFVDNTGATETIPVTAPGSVSVSGDYSINSSGVLKKES